MKAIVFIFTALLAVAFGQAPKSSKDCACDAPSCNPGLDPKSLCTCINNGAKFCYYRNSSKGCPAPLLRDCVNDPLGKNLKNGTATAGQKQPPEPTPFIPPPHQGLGGINCVEIGYCSRPNRLRTSMVLTVNGTATTILVPVGLPTPDLGPEQGPNLPVLTPASGPAATQEPAVQFTPLPAADGALKRWLERRDQKGEREEKVLREQRRKLARWIG